jgi:hypothetical protein
MKALKRFKASVWCVFAMSALFWGWLVYYGNPYLNMVVIPIVEVVALLFASWLQRTEFKVRGRFLAWFLNGDKLEIRFWFIG